MIRLRVEFKEVTTLERFSIVLDTYSGDSNPAAFSISAEVFFEFRNVFEIFVAAFLFSDDVAPEHEPVTNRTRPVNRKK